MGSGTSDWSDWWEETAVSTAQEVASVIRTHYSVPTANGSATSDATVTNGLSHAQANDLVRRFVEVFSRRLESEILHKSLTVNAEDANNAQSTSYEFPSNSSSGSVYNQRGATHYNNVSTEAASQHLPNGESHHEDLSSNQDKHRVTSGDEHRSNKRLPNSNSEVVEAAAQQNASTRKPFYRRYSHILLCTLTCESFANLI